MATGSGSPVSFPVNVARLPRKGMPVVIEAGADERAALAAAHGLLDLPAFRAEVSVVPWKSGGVRVDGRVRARVVQECIVTLDPVEADVDEEIAALFVPAGSKLAVPARSAEGEIILDAEGDDAPEVFSGDTIDVGQLVEEFFAMGIDPYPRKAGVSLDQAPADGDGPRGPLHEKLAALRRKL